MPWVKSDIRILIRHLVRETDADVICLQEVFNGNFLEPLRQIAKALGYVAYIPESVFTVATPFGFANSSGLATLVKDRLTSRYHGLVPFEWKAGFEQLVKKGFQVTQIISPQGDFTVLNTHLQSDMAEIPYIRIHYPVIRLAQENQIAYFLSKLRCGFLIGDLNQANFKWMRKFATTYHKTMCFKDEQIDHMVFIPQHAGCFRNGVVRYLEHFPYSDHMPVEFTFEAVLQPPSY